MESIFTNDRIEVVSTGTLKNKKGKLVLGAKGKKFKCHHKIAEKYFVNGWIEDFKPKEKKAEK